jgi:hypothetical protein
MAQRIPVFVYASDPISQAGVSAQLRHRPEIHVVDDGIVLYLGERSYTYEDRLHVIPLDQLWLSGQG